MLILVIGIVALLMVNISAQTGVCSGVCPDGSNVALPYEFIYSIAVTCGDLDQYAKATTIAADCEAYQAYAPICGCPGFEPVCLGVCYNGASFSNPYLLLTSDGYYFTCQDIDTALKQSIDATECAVFQNDLIDLCGCPNAATAPVTTTTTTTTYNFAPAMPTARVPSSPASMSSIFNTNGKKKPISKPSRKSSSFVNFNRWVAFTLVSASVFVATMV
jgi:hypothetical protein